jgi:hypothetical protein
MFIPPQGFRHATALLLTQGCRAIPPGASPESVASALVALAHDLVALADDMRAAPESAEWLLVEYARIVEQLPQTFDRAAARASASAILARVAARHPLRVDRAEAWGMGRKRGDRFNPLGHGGFRRDAQAGRAHENRMELRADRPIEGQNVPHGSPPMNQERGPRSESHAWPRDERPTRSFWP